MLTKALLSAFSRVVRVTGPLRAMSWNVSIPLRVSFHLRAPESLGQSILATWLNSSPFLSDNALNCSCWFTVLKAHQSYGFWLRINHPWRAPPGFAHTLLLTVVYAEGQGYLYCTGICRTAAPAQDFSKCQGYDRTNLVHENYLILRHLRTFKAPRHLQLHGSVTLLKEWNNYLLYTIFFKFH